MSLTEILIEKQSVKRHLQALILRVFDPLLDQVQTEINALEERVADDAPVSIRNYILPRVPCSEATIYNHINSGKLTVFETPSGKKLPTKREADTYIEWLTNRRTRKLDQERDKQ